MEVGNTKIEGVKLISCDVHQDDRGAFYEAYQKEEFERNGLPTEFIQCNVSYSHKGVLRGMHVQKNNPQGKLIRCLAGFIWDVWVDLRKGSPTFGKWEGVSLGGEKVEAVYLPPGVAHGFFAPTAIALVHYMCTTAYDKESDGGVRWDDAKVKIKWPFPSDFIPLVSAKDMNLPSLDEYLESLV